MNKKSRDKTFLSIMAVLFIVLNCTIISFGHRLTYDVKKNNCTHMSRQLEDMIEKLGVPVTLKTGGTTDGSRHMWIKIWGWLEVDSTTLVPMVNTKYNRHIIEYESFDKYEKRYT